MQYPCIGKSSIVHCKRREKTLLQYNWTPPYLLFLMADFNNLVLGKKIVDTTYSIDLWRNVYARNLAKS